jgi:hypothetical protein
VELGGCGDGLDRVSLPKMSMSVDSSLGEGGFL